MTRLLEKAIDQLKSLPEQGQDDLARSILDEINWEYTIPAEGNAKLASLASEALEEYRSGKTQPMKK
jgi:hypothetical protein